MMVRCLGANREVGCRSTSCTVSLSAPANFYPSGWAKNLSCKMFKMCPILSNKVISWLVCTFMVMNVADKNGIFRGSVLEDSIPALKSEKIKTIPTKEVLDFCFPELQLSR